MKEITRRDFIARTLPLIAGVSGIAAFPISGNAESEEGVRWIDGCYTSTGYEPWPDHYEIWMGKLPDGGRTAGGSIGGKLFKNREDWIFHMDLEYYHFEADSVEHAKKIAQEKFLEWMQKYTNMLAKFCYPVKRNSHA